MEIVIWIGAAITAAGFAAILWSLLAVLRLRRQGLEDAEMRARLARVVPLNIGALMLSMLGLMMVVVGIILS
ncbi:hypothetical protein FHS00_003505 [Limimaricola variabilis]|jgi:hypothetical protein|uniref:Uncharacterized protein n=1 Tax=Limimaricola variabilis TaxID=1492771 RepID=A0ABR6HTK2_9RHOB|nr:hypothetical protein [Limimaricola variabilis]MBB3713898.1 hypothetical protein [Limimaricola variabilis]WPY95640.1 hypothetical protein T8T21_05840 [Limimaricola variabilis]